MTNTISFSHYLSRSIIRGIKEIGLTGSLSIVILLYSHKAEDSLRALVKSSSIGLRDIPAYTSRLSQTVNCKLVSITEEIEAPSLLPEAVTHRPTMPWSSWAQCSWSSAKSDLGSLCPNQYPRILLRLTKVQIKQTIYYIYIYIEGER